MSGHLVRFHDGERFCAGIETGQGRKYRHLVTITDGGVRLAEIPIEQGVEVLGEVRNKHIAIMRRVGRAFGITKAAETALVACQDGGR